MLGNYQVATQLVASRVVLFHRLVLVTSGLKKRMKR
jgi:hypothetical protein